MSEFNIILDKTIEFNSNQKLFVMLIKEGNSFFLEIDDQCSLVGRIEISNEYDAREQYHFIYDKLSQINDFIPCRSLVQLTFHSYSFEEVKFLTHLITTQNLTWETIFDLKNLHPFLTECEFRESTIEDKLPIDVIHVTFEGQKKSIGKFIRETGNEEFQFVFNKP